MLGKGSPNVNWHIGAVPWHQGGEECKPSSHAGVSVTFRVSGHGPTPTASSIWTLDWMPSALSARVSPTLGRASCRTVGAPPVHSPMSGQTALRLRVQEGPAGAGSCGACRTGLLVGELAVPPRIRVGQGGRATARLEWHIPESCRVAGRASPKGKLGAVRVNSCYHSHA